MRDNLIKIGDFDKYNNDTMVINWLITRFCNYTCSYCPVYDNSKPFVSFLNLTKAVDEIKKLDKERYLITITGGEPTMHPQFIEFLEYLFECLGAKLKVSIITNLSRGTSFYDKFVKKFDKFKGNISLITSYHFEFAEKNDFINRLKFLSDNKIRTFINFMVNPQFMDEAKSIYLELKVLEKAFLSVNPIAIRDGDSLDSRYSKEDIEWLESKYTQVHKNITAFYKHGDDVVSKKFLASELNTLRMTNFKGMLCDAGVNNFVINSNGEVHKAICFRGPNKTLSEFNIYADTDLKEYLFASRVVCPFDRCNCAADLAIPKYNVD